MVHKGGPRYQRLSRLKHVLHLMHELNVKHYETLWCFTLHAPLESVSSWRATIRWLVHLASQHIGHSRGKELIYADSQNSWHIKLLPGQGLDLGPRISSSLARSVRAHFRRWKGAQSGPH